MRARIVGLASTPYRRVFVCTRQHEVVSPSRELSRRLRAITESRKLYLFVGGTAAFLSWVVMPLLGLIAGFCGMELYRKQGLSLSGIVIGGIGIAAVLTWFVILAVY